MTSPQPPFQLQLTEEQKEILHRATGEHVAAIVLTPDPSDASSGKGRGLHFSWRISVDSGIPRQQWVLGGAAPPPAPDEGASP
jgi:hypothetical protein